MRFLVLLFILSSTLYSNTKIYLGNEEDQIGFDKSEDGIWLPIFFDVDDDENVHFPDFYKGRIAVFNNGGELVTSYFIEEGISPRMNYFSLNPNGTYTTFDNGTLYLLDDIGSIIWKSEIGLGNIPISIYTDDRGIFLKLSGSDFTYYSYSSNRPLGNIKNILLNGKKQVPDSTLLYQDNTHDIWINKDKIISIIQNNEVINRIPVKTDNLGSGYTIRVKSNRIYSILITMGYIEVLDLGVF